MNDVDYPISDDDLREQLKNTVGIGGPALKRVLVAEQRRRDEEAVRRAKLTPTQRRRDNLRQKTERDAPDPQDLRHIHSVLALCGLPYTRQSLDVRRYERKQGRMSLTVHAGELKDPTGESIVQPLPYGSRARLLMLHLCSEAVRQKSPTIQIEDSLTAFIRAIGYPVTGGPRGTLTAFKQQLNALAACRLQFGMWDGKRARNINAVPFNEIDVWMPDNPGQRILWPSTITFSTDFFNSLKTHALPVNVDAVRTFSNSSRKLDLLFWLGYRLNTIKKPLAISWAALKEQFGESYSRERDFRARFATEIEELKDAFPRLQIELSETGIVIARQGPDVLAIPKTR